MDRRQRKTREAIFTAFSQLLEKKRYEHITVQEIIDRADVGRSTFYAHFETKDALLKAVCSDIFDHIFEGELCEYSGENNDFEEKLTHILWHLKNRGGDVMRILSSESSDLFTNYLREYLLPFFCAYLDELVMDIPKDFLLSHLVGSFNETLKYWVKGKMELAPEEIARYYAACYVRFTNE